MFIFKVLIPTTEARTCCVVYSMLCESSCFPVRLAEELCWIVCQCQSPLICSGDSFPRLRGFPRCMSCSALSWIPEGILCTDPKFPLYTMLSPSVLWPATLTLLNHPWLSLGPLPSLPRNSQGSKLGCERAHLACFTSLRHHCPVLSDAHCLSWLRLP